jgi:hypothetical protein
MMVAKRNDRIVIISSVIGLLVAKVDIFLKKSKRNRQFFNFNR